MAGTERSRPALLFLLALAPIVFIGFVIERYGVTPDYLRVMGLSLRAGRFFREVDVENSQPVVVISESTARMVWGTDNPIGSEVRSTCIRPAMA